MFGTRKLGKTSAQRKALLRQQVTDLLENGKIETTFYRACGPCCAAPAGKRAPMQLDVPARQGRLRTL